MAKAEGIPPTASVASVGPGIRYVGIESIFAYAYSGAIAVNNNETTLIESTSQAGIIVAEFQPQYLVKSGDDYFFQIYLNNLVVVGVHLIAADTYTPYEKSKIILPPFTEVKITAQNTTDSSSNNVAAVLTGRVYDV